MGREIERKFLVNSQAFKEHASVQEIRQGYLTTDAGKAIRIREINDKAWLNIKAELEGFKRYEYEYAIPLEDAREMLDKLSLRPLIEKKRYKVNYEGKRWEVDEFAGENAGLTVAEIELEHEEEPFSKPPWLGKEVTGDTRYYNAYLANYPYKTWQNGQ